ncbi:YpjP family protein [Sporolactobacillus sp. THM19-2]|uniref:YpjP family protein n=1 Tax=Sporolactobacillus sp. THM19-2 TaxID=2511171 RepID=UPI001020CEC9|nr:YpjP family protein [Sporolactobacillus sp. THM19-2]RYL93551.1 hypothetical protein EWH91_03635 [Sporolactobacillus sp. THM19-2]
MIPKFMRKTLIGIVAVLTFGAIVPTFPANYLDKQSDKQNIQSTKGQKTDLPAYVETQEASRRTGWSAAVPDDEPVEKLISAFSSYALLEVRYQGLHKFGRRITEKMGYQYATEVAPAFAAVIRELSRGHDSEWVRSLAVTHSAAPGLGERILHIYNTDSGKNVLKLHVRRDHPPLDGYWFDFHYHSARDGFQAHHELKKIYWGKNIPPKWRA